MIHKPGIHFGMEAAEYHADESLSTSALKLILQDPEEYWENSHMNPNRPPEEVKDNMTRGTLWHCRILEPERFDEKYVVAPHITGGDFEGKRVLKTVADMQAWLDDNGIHYKKSMNKESFERAVMEGWKLGLGDPEPYLFDRMNEDFGIIHAGKTVIWGKDAYEEMLAAEKAVQDHPYFSKVFQGGMSEVAIFWIDEETGIPMKGLIDKLKPNVIMDYKTLYVPRGKPARKAALDAIKFEKYDLQSAVYIIGMAHVVNALNAGTASVYGNVEASFIDKLVQSPEKKFGFVFQKEDRPYTVRGLTVVRRGGDLFNVFGAGLLHMQQGIQTFQRFRELYGEKRWVDPDGMIEIADHEVYYAM